MYGLLLGCTIFSWSIRSSSGSDSHSHTHNVFSKASNKYFYEYQKAKDLYSNASCSGYECYLTVIKEDLKPFSGGIDLNMIQSAYSRGVKYVVLNKRIYREKTCLFPTRCEGVDYFLNYIRESLPDSHFVVNFHDWPQINKHFHSNIPVFSFSKTDDYYDIMYPAWSFWKGGPALSLYPTGIGRWDQLYSTITKKSESWPWDKKTESGFFIGSRTSAERDNLILLSRAYPSLVIAKYTKNQAWKSNKDTLNQPPADEIPLEEHCKYKYLFNFRGVAASFRLKFLFLCNSTVIHIGNDWKEFFYESLKPWYHYVPMDSTASQEDYKRPHKEDIRSNHGRKVCVIMKAIVKLHDHLAAPVNQRIFLLRCRSNGLLPPHLESLLKNVKTTCKLSPKYQQALLNPTTGYKFSVTKRSILEFLREEDDIAQEIATRGFNFIYNNLKMEDVINYWKILLKEYSKLLKFVPKLHNGLIEVTTTTT